MTSDDVDEVIAPRDGKPYEPHDFLAEMLRGAYASGTVLEYFGVELQCQKYEDGPRAWDVWGEENWVETINLDAVQTVSELQEILNDFVAYRPANREEWEER